MNLRSIANGAIRGINNNQSILWKRSTGYAVNSDYSRTPTFEEVAIEANVQAVSGKLLEHVSAMNIQGVVRSVYLSGNALGVSASGVRGGDILRFSEFFGEGTKEWKVVHVVETWDTWSHVIVVLQ